MNIIYKLQTVFVVSIDEDMTLRSTPEACAVFNTYEGAKLYAEKKLHYVKDPESYYTIKEMEIRND
jgi:hypothetical protein